MPWLRFSWIGVTTLAETNRSDAERCAAREAAWQAERQRVDEIARHWRGQMLWSTE